MYIISKDDAKDEAFKAEEQLDKRDIVDQKRTGYMEKITRCNENIQWEN